MLRIARVLAALLLAVALVAVAAGPAAAGSDRSRERSASLEKKKTPKRKGGKVRRSWPRGNGPAPADRLERWLARQVGPRKPRKKTTRNKAAVFLKSGNSASSGATIPATSSTNPLRLVRSFAIPVGDPSYDRLLNWSWTYDSAVTATAFAATGYSSQAQQLLDQLQALQRTDGSIETAFNVYTGASSEQMRSGTVAWTGLAAATYDAAKLSSRYAEMARDSADWLLTQRVTDTKSPVHGLIKGGPDVTWVSTQHNLIAYTLFVRLGLDPSSGSKMLTYLRAADDIGDKIESQLLVQPNSSTAYFKQGYADDVRPLDTQAFGALFLLSRGKASTALKVRSYIESNFAVSGRSIVKSSVAGAFNNTYAASGPFVGYRPYAAGTGPDVLWAEGTAQVRLLQDALDVSTKVLDGNVVLWDKVAGSAGPLQADRTAADALNEYHVWPAAAAGAWRILSGAPATYFMVVSR